MRHLQTGTETTGSRGGRQLAISVRQGSPAPGGWSQIDGARMAWLVHSDLGAAGQAKTGEPSPPLLGDVLGELDALGAKVSHGGFHVIAHEEQLVSGWAVGGMHGELCGGQLEDQPPAASVHVRLPEDVSEEGAVRFRITAEQDHMAAIDHVMRLRGRTTGVMEASTTAVATDGPTGGFSVCGQRVGRGRDDAGCHPINPESSGAIEAAR